MAEATMVGAVFVGEGRLELLERPRPQLRRGTDVLLDVEACGICGSDLKILSVPPGHDATAGVILGHEFVGVVREIGDEVTSLRPGDRVVVAPNISCGQCIWCRRGARVHCESFTTHGIFVDGGLAPEVCVPASACHRIAPHVPRHIAALAEPLSTVVHGAQRAGVFPADMVVVIGGGPIGLMFTALLRHAGATVLVVEPTPERAELAHRMGASATLAPDSRQLRDTVSRTTAGLGADVVIDAVGSQLGAALTLVRKGGRIVLFGVNSVSRTELTQFDITHREIEIFGSFVGQDVFPTAIRILEQGAIDFEPLVTHRIALEALPHAVQELRAGRAVKVQVEFA